MAEITVIVPVYNKEPWLRRCIDSVRNQTFSDWELLLVDDGSTDGCGALCDEYAALDARVRAFHQANRGWAAARNLGIDRASGKYILFCDADDYLERDALEAGYRGMTEHDVDYVIGGANIVVYDGDKTVSVTPGAPEEDYFFDTANLAEGGTHIWNISGILFYCVWGRLFKADIIRDHSLKFDLNIYVQEDFNFVLRYYYHTRKCMACATTFYNYTRTVGKDDIGEKPVIDQHNFNEVTLISFLRLAYKFQYPEDYCTLMYANISEQYIRLTSKLFLERTGLTPEEQRRHVYAMADNFIFRFFCEKLSPSDPFWDDMRGYLESGDPERIYLRMKKKIDEDLLPPCM